MLRIRRVEETLATLYAEQEMRCPMHLCIGQEAIAVGVCEALHKSDKVFSNHRAHGHYLAKGGSLKGMIAELYGRADGCCGGRGGSMHLIDLDAGFMGATPIVGGTVPLAVGSAWASKLKSDSRVTVIFFGDGCFEEGVVHEAMNFATLNKIPIVFVCENNGFSVYTRLENRQPPRPIHEVAGAHGMRAVAGDGNNVEAVFDIASDAIGRARRGEGPQFIEFNVYRWREHCGPNFDDDLGYRSTEEIEAGLKGCPLDTYRPALLNALGDADAAIGTMEQDVKQEIQTAVSFARNSAEPTINDGFSKLYA